MKQLIVSSALAGILSLNFATAGLALITQPADERARQALMPRSNDPIWSILQKSRISADQQRGLFLADNPPEVVALDGREMTVSGFILALDPSPRFNHFLLTRNTPVCAFCPPGQPNEAIEVYTTRPLRYTGGPVTVKGRFKLENNAEAGLFFRLEVAELS